MANKYKRKSEPLNRWVALVMALISIFMGTVFSSTLFFNQPIAKEDATELTYTYTEFIVHTKRGGFTNLKLLFNDGSAQYIHACCVNDKLVQKLEQILIGTEFKMLVNPQNNNVVELIANDVALLDFDYAQKELEIYGVEFFILGIVMYVFAIIFIIQAILDFKRKIKRAKRKKSNK